MRALLPAMLGLVLLVPLVPAQAPLAWWEQPLGIPEGERASLPANPSIVLPVMPGDDVIVPVDRNQDEFSIAANPTNPDNLVAGANDYSLGDAWAGFYTTSDGGAHWTHGYIPLPSLYTASGDPAIAFDKDGAAYYIGIAFNRGSTNGGANGIFVSKSTDGGQTWVTSIPFSSPNGGTFHDKPYVATDPNSGAILLTYTHFGSNGGISFSKSTDGGLTFSPRKVLGGGQFSLPVAGNNGEIYVTWAGGGAQFVRSLDGGATFQSFSTGMFLAINPPGVNFRYSAYPAMGVARGGPNPGRIWLAGPQGADIVVQSSDDKGATWSAAQAIQRDGIQFNEWLAVQPDGTVGVSYMDTYPETMPLGLSGTLFGPEPLGHSLSVRDPLLGIWTHQLLTDQQSRKSTTSFWGDYEGLAATSKGFHPAFGDGRNGDGCGCVSPAKLDFGTMRVNPHLI
ncbi:MAG TPA: sialidase family protein [Chloroflexota bacterium]|nr:sialidase family protein [Chloroflexota bacterium]